MRRIDIGMIYVIILLGIFSLSLYIRGFLPYGSVFGGSYINFGGNDPWYNFRLVENTLHNFPHRIYFDPYTFYPHGSIVPFAPLFDYLIASVIWVIGLGNPYVTLGEEGIRTIFAFFPIVLGALVIIPVYFIGKELYNRNVGILSAIIVAILPGQFLSRSLLGFTDHHVMEVLMSTIVMLLFFITIRISKNIKEINWATIKRPLLYSSLLGITLGAFYLSWNGSPLFMLIFLFYSVIQYMIDHLREKETYYLVITAVPAFIISLLMILPFLFTPYKKFVEIQVLSLLLGIGVFLVLGIISHIYQKRNIDIMGYPITILAVGVFFVIFISLVVPGMYQKMLGSLGVIFPSGVQLTIAEVNSMRMSHILKWFSTTFFVAILGFGVVGVNIIKKIKPEEVLFIVWSVMVLFICFKQNRFAYYYAVNVSLLCGLFSWKVIDIVWSKKELNNSKTKGKSRKSRKNQKIRIRKNYKTLIVCLGIFLVVMYPALDISLTSARYAGKIPNDWYESLIWMKENTPQLEIDYYDTYKTSDNGYKYPDSVYSVMSWWDYGHWITTIANRIPISNPFQQGAYEAAEYLVETDEYKANEMLDNLNAKYVIIDYPMTDFLQTPTNPNPKYVMPIWAKRNPNPLQTIMIRLHYFDGSEVESENIQALQHYRLVYESKTFVLPFMIIDNNNGKTLGWQAYHGDYGHIRNDLHKLYQGAMIQGQENLIAKTPEFFHPFGFVKIFEYVPELSIIEGESPNGTLVTASIEITTNQGRKFFYNQTMLSDGKYSFSVPYSGNYKIIERDDRNVNIKFISLSEKTP